MKIGAAQQAYSAQIKSLGAKRSQLVKMREESEKNGDTLTLEQVNKEFEKVDSEYSKASEFMDSFGSYRNLLMNAESSKRQSEAMEKQAEEIAKILEIFRRISKGDIVPEEDEKKLMEFDSKLYMMAKNMAMMNRDKDSEEHDSLWDEDDKPKEYDMSVTETVDNMECGVTMPADLSAGIAEALE